MNLDKKNQSEKAVFDFWDRWFNASEIEKPDIIKELNMDAYVKDLELKGSFNRRLNSYFNDLWEYASEVLHED